MRELPKRFLYEFALCASFLPLIHSTFSYSAEAPSIEMLYDVELVDAEMPVIADLGQENLLAAQGVPSDEKIEEPMHTVNFNNVSVIELIRFASKITGLNFVFEEGDLQFSVTLVSEEAISARSFVAALSQMMRVHDLILLEENGNVLITKSSRVNQIAPIVSADLPHSKAGNAAIVTRVFRIKNANVNTVANIIRPMTSDTALIEVSVETRQLIVTDITTNVEQIATLLMSIDSPHTPLDIESYVVKNITPEQLIALTELILAPFAEGNPLHFIPQVDTNAIYVVSTPYLIDRALTVMEDLDVPPKPIIVTKGGPKSVFFYKAQAHVPAELVDELSTVLSQLKSEGGLNPELAQAISTVQVVDDSNSLMFITDATTAAKLQEILTSLDSPASGKTQSTFFIYNPQYRAGSELASSMQDIKTNLKASGLANSALIQAISSMRWVESTNSLIFTGDAESLAQIQGIIKSLDTPTAFNSNSSQVFIYKPQFVSPDQIQNALTSLVPSLQSTNSQSDQNLVKAIQAMEWNSQTQSFMTTSDPATIERLKTVLASIDTAAQGAAGSSKGYYLYKLQHAKGDFVLNELKHVTSKLAPSSLQNQNLIETVNKIEWIKSNNALLITGSNDAIAQVKTLIEDFDQESGLPSGGSFLIYKPKFLPAQEIQAALTDLANNLETSGLNDPALLQTLTAMRYVPLTNSILFTGTQETLDKVQGLIGTIDNPNAVGAIQRIGNVTFLLYKVKEADTQQLINSLKLFAQDLKQTNIQDKDLAESIDKVRWIKETNSLLFTGPQEVLQRIEELLKKFDTSQLKGETPSVKTPSTYVIYSPKYVPGDELITILCEFVHNLSNSGVSDADLFDTINNLKWIPKTSSLLVSGPSESVEKVQQLLIKFDVPGKAGAKEAEIESIENTSFLVYKLKYHPGNDIQESLKQIASNLAKSTSASPALTQSINSIQWLQVTNSLLATGQQDILLKLKELIQNLDVPLRQVFIEVLVIETSLSNIQNFGLQWGSQMQYLNKTALGTGNFVLPTGDTAGQTATSTFPTSLQAISATVTPVGGAGAAASVPFFTGFDLGVIGDIIMHKGKSFISLGALLNAIQTDSDTTVLLNPKLITQDNRQSTIFVGQNVPYTGALVTNTGQNSTVSTANIEYRDVGVSLTITPILGDNEVVTMEITQDISEQVGSNAGTPNTQVTGITTNHTHLDTRVSVPNNHFVAISGQINQSKAHSVQGIPCLGGLPVIGAIFSETARTANKTNVIIFVKPTIINSFDEYKQITEHQEWLFKDNARMQMLKEEFDEGIDLVKTPDNE